MPKEIIESATTDGWADTLICWGPDEVRRGSGMPDEGEPFVKLFVRPQRMAGGIYFRPDRPEDYGLNPGDSVGPVYINLTMDGVDQLINTLKRAKKKSLKAATTTAL